MSIYAPAYNSHWTAVKRIPRYLNGTQDYGVYFHVSNTPTLHAFHIRRLGWQQRWLYLHWRLHFLHGSSFRSMVFKETERCSSLLYTKVEYCSLANIAAEVSWTTLLLVEFGIKVPTTPTIYCDNIREISSLEIWYFILVWNYHFMWGYIQSGQIWIVLLQLTSLPMLLQRLVSRVRFDTHTVKIGLFSGLDHPSWKTW